MTRAQWGVLLRLERQEGHDAGRNGRGPRDSADLACAPDRPLVRARAGRAAAAPQRPARQPPLPHATKAARRCPASFPWAVRSPPACWLRSARRKPPASCDMLLRIKGNIRKASAAQRRPAPQPTGCAMLAKPSWLARVYGPLGPRRRLPSLRMTLLVLIPALVAADRRSSSTSSAAATCRPTTPTSAPQKVLITPEVSGKVVRIAVVEGQLLKPGDELLAIDPVPYRLAAQEAEAKLVRVRSDFATLKSQSRQPRRRRSSCHARAWPPPRPISTARPSCSATASARHPTSTNRRMALIAAKTQLELLEQQERDRCAFSCSDDPSLRDREVSPVHRGHRGARSRQARSRQHRAARAHRRHGHAGGQHPDGALPHRRHGRLQRHQQRQRLDRRQPQGDRPHLRAPRPACDHHGRRISRPGSGAARSAPSAPARARSSPSSRRRTPPATGSRSCSACRCASSSRRVRTCAGCAPA